MIHGPSKMGKFRFCLFYFLFFMSCNVCYSKLSPNQTSTMMEISSILNISAWSEQNPCSWNGVLCSQPDNFSVIRLSFSGFDLSNSGFLPLVCKIQTLKALDVSDNRLSSIPDGFVSNCQKLEGLKLLNFSSNNFSSFPSFRGFSALEVLDFSRNVLRGSIGDYGFDGLVQLKTLSLSFNSLTGSVPTSLAKSMEKLHVSDNLLDGSLPEGIAAYPELTLIDLSDNHLIGPIPISIGNLSKLETFVLSNNHLSGQIPNSVSSIQTLRRFAANRNLFTGPIPSGITKHLSNLDLSFNYLNGSIPDDLLSQSNLVSVDLSFNQLNGSVPQHISPNLVRLRLGSNKLTGILPPAAFESLEDLTYLELDNNTLTGHIPRELALCQSLTLLNLAANQFTGSLPSDLGNLSKLQGMEMQQNKLTGRIPDEITLLGNLLILNISWNSLSGSIPTSVSLLEKLSNMDLQGNDLNGSIPDNIGNLSSLIELQLGQNQLSGEIPIMPSSLQISLNLSHNRFKGHIPELILSNNQLTGDIPTFNPKVLLETNGNPGLSIENTTQDSQKRSVIEKRKLAVVPIFTSLAAAVLAAGIITVIALKLSRRFNGINDVQLDQREIGSALPQVFHGKLLTTNVRHRSIIDFTKAMEAVSNPENALSKTRFWSYYRVAMPSGLSYFIKKLNTSDRLIQLVSRDKLEQELEILGKLSNSNVMVPLAYVLSNEECLLFYEIPEKGTLYDVLHNHSGEGLDWPSRYSIAVGIAQGISYLHGSSSHDRDPILHLDLSSRKIMLRSLTEPLVGDIELYKVIDPSKSTTSLSAVAGTIGYIPPEYAYTMRVTMAGNVYNFGVILLELLTGKPAMSQGSELAKWVQSRSSQQDQCDQILDPRVSRSSPVTTSHMLRVLGVALHCINISPGARPKMKTVLRMLINSK
ncbi:PREDICTED: probable leucine-rich repeat receptor-like protein kinase At5g63930 isoform X2 [Tarenaya hassleriana]|uniref:probable leucine-rich repeat receptor-like protein kinase At5g63930 isoform X2 n=1 Tax=Tarenaya hassleriana TaxID=28532 RepID=UPI00053CA429|nr:PREDICTED: probable leucine-rich repeat receptor-like protein kinase At5g63930 isoform X2 [Tarenaya hassleriana]